MSKAIKAIRATIQIGNLTVDGLMLPDGSYQVPQVFQVQVEQIERG